ncbi:MAG: hypothetical protein IH795_01395 [Bacteroidetes bacterium]|nr:hypothetical protein [Bacteroidota bacterium]
MQRKITSIILPKGEKEDYYKNQFVELMRYISDEHKDAIKFEQKKDVMKLQIKNTFELPERLLEFLIDISASIKELFVKVEE